MDEKRSLKHILLYIPHLDQRYGGLRQYSVNLMRTLASLDEDAHKISILHYNEDPEILKVVKEFPNFSLFDNSNAKVPGLLRFRNFLSTKILLVAEFLFGRKKHLWKIVSFLDFLIEKENITIIHCPYQDLPKTSKKVFLITTMHDVQELHFPGFFNPKERSRRAKNYLDFTLRSNHIIASYEHIKKDLVRFFEIDPQKISVVLLPMGNLWFNHMTENSESLNSYDLPENFLLYPANSWRHKNHIGLLKAIKQLRDRGMIVNLVFTGSFENENGGEVNTYISDNDLEGQVKVLGVVNETILLSLYKECVGVVVPTLYEAGSFPLMESILLGVPVICSNVTSLPETIGHADYIFDPNDIDEMAKKVEQLFTDQQFRQASLQQAEKMKDRLLSNQAVKIIEEVYARS